MKTIKLVFLTVLGAIFLSACSKPPSCDDKISADIVKKKIMDIYVSQMGAGLASNILLVVRDVKQIGKLEESGNYRCSAMVDFTNMANNFTASAPVRFETILSENDGKPDVAPFYWKLN